MEVEEEEGICPGNIPATEQALTTVGRIEVGGGASEEKKPRMVTRRRMFVGVEREELPRVVGLVVGEPGKDVSFVSRPRIWEFKER